MHIWVDADACPRPVKEVLFKASVKRRVALTLVANHYLPASRSSHITVMQVAAGFDVADNEIVRRIEPGDLVVTADIPLADEVISAGGIAVNPRGTRYTPENIKDHLSRRDMMDQLRSSGAVSGGPPAFNRKDVAAFANELDKLLTRAGL